MPIIVDVCTNYQSLDSPSWWGLLEIRWLQHPCRVVRPHQRESEMYWLETQGQVKSPVYRCYTPSTLKNEGGLFEKS